MRSKIIAVILVLQLASAATLAMMEQAGAVPAVGVTVPIVVNSIPPEEEDLKAGGGMGRAEGGGGGGSGERLT